MDGILLLAAVFAAGWFIGSRLTAAFHIRLFKMILEDLKISNKDLIRVARENGAGFITEEQEARLAAAEAADLEHIEIKVEKHGDMLYAFRVDNDKFLGQGTSRDALIAEMAHHIKNVRCTVVEGDEYMKSEA